jgi:glycogen operon protein
MGVTSSLLSVQVRVQAPAADSVVVEWNELGAAGSPARSALERVAGGYWEGSVTASEGSVYWLRVDDGPALVDPSCRDLMLTTEGPRSVVRAPWPTRAQGAPLAEGAVVYELHVKGFGGSYLGCIEHLDHVAATGANVVELMPVHPFDNSDNYWGYMPIVWGAVHRGYATDPGRAAEELAALVSAAHDRGLHVWIDVVFNHVHDRRDHEIWGLTGLPGATTYRRHADGRLTNDSGCGNDINPADPWVRDLVIEGLDRYADLGVDGFRFDLASLLTRDGGGLVSRITEWGATRGVTLVAEAWDLGAYQLGHGWPWPTWLQWNDRFRDSVRGLVRGENGWVRAVRLRVQGSPDLFGPDGADRSLNFVTAHDGLTLHDLTSVTSDHHHAWDCGPDLRVQQLKNYFAILLLAAGTPMWVMGDEFGRTQGGHDNPYNLDSDVSWVDWSRVAEWADLGEFVRSLVALRRSHPPVRFRFYGIGPNIDESYLSHSLAWCSGDLYVMVNMWWEPLTFEVQEEGVWGLAACTAGDPSAHTALSYTLAPRSIVVLRRSPAR